MEINVNHQNLNVPGNCNLRELLSSIDYPTKGIAIAVNNNIIPKSDWEHHILNSQDQITIIKATQGG